MLNSKRNLLSAALASAILAATLPVYAQDQAAADEATAEEKSLREKEKEKATQLDTYEVTGYASSIQKAIAIKQDSTSIVEAVSAEDIGKLPDISIADSLSRLPGLTAQRVAGRSSTINIRGLAGDFSTTLLNGREQVSAGDNRGVEFDQYPSELLSGVLVYKTPDAKLPAQGISGTVDLQTVSPLSYTGPTVSINVRGEKNSLGELNDGYSDMGSRFSAAFIDTFADDTIGLAIGYARLDSPGQFKEWEAWGFPTATVNGQPDVLVLGGNKIKSGSSENVRDGLMAVLEFAPNDSYTGKLDVYYSKFERSEATRWLEFGLGWSGASLSNPVVNADGVLVGGTWNGVKPVVRTDLSEFDDKLFAIGFNNDFWINEDLRITADVSMSRADRNQEILEVYTGAQASDTVQFTMDPNNGPAQFQFGLDYSDPTVVGLNDPGGWGQDGYVKYPNIDDELRSARLAVERSFVDGAFSSFEAGVNYSNREKSRSSDEFFLDLADGDFQLIPSQFLQSPTSVAFSNTGIVTYDTRGVVDAFHNLRPNLCRDCAAKNWTVEEDIIQAFAQLNIDTDFGAFPVRGNIGLQYIDVDQTSTGLAVIGGNGGSPVVVQDGDNYGKVLPNLNLAMSLTDTQTLRFGAARQVARPRMDHMRFFADYGIDQQRGIWSGSGGNPRLRPWEANSFDVSWENYFADGKGYVSAAAFHKSLKSYIYEAVNYEFDFSVFDLSAFTDQPASTIGEFRQQVNGEGGTINGYELAASIPLSMFWEPLEGFGIVANYSDTKSSIAPSGPDGPVTQTLPGLSRYVSNLTAYYENGGFSFRVSQRSRSSFRGEIQGFGADRETQFIRGEDVIDLQTGYEFKKGPLEGLSVLVQVNNLTNEEYREYFRDPNVSDRPRKYVEYGRTMLLGLNYKF